MISRSTPSLPVASQPVVDLNRLITEPWLIFLLNLRARLSAGTLNITWVQVIGGPGGNSPYTIVSSDCGLACDSTNGPIVINLISPISKGQVFVVIDKARQAGNNKIMLVGTIDGQVNPELTSNGDKRWLSSTDGKTWSFLT